MESYQGRTPAHNKSLIMAEATRERSLTLLLKEVMGEAPLKALSQESASLAASLAPCSANLGLPVLRASMADGISAFKTALSYNSAQRLKVAFVFGCGAVPNNSLILWRVAIDLALIISTITMAKPATSA
uniref:Uncharacterized protein n=1 Tax=Vitis vinifera TaxID=29760 RepID=F6H709_VITVI